MGCKGPCALGNTNHARVRGARHAWYGQHLLDVASWPTPTHLRSHAHTQTARFHKLSHPHAPTHSRAHAPCPAPADSGEHHGRAGAGQGLPAGRAGAAGRPGVPRHLRGGSGDGRAAVAPARLHRRGEADGGAGAVHGPRPAGRRCGRVWGCGRVGVARARPKGWWAPLQAAGICGRACGAAGWGTGYGFEGLGGDSSGLVGWWGGNVLDAGGDGV